jgi:endo-alpha-1,4-polygalactosaminidase (GH114 family)
MAIQKFGLQYGNVNADAVAAQNYDLFITESRITHKGEGVNPTLTETELAKIQKGGTKVVGYVHTMVTDDTRSYWDKGWTTNGADGAPTTGSAPKWMVDKPANQ